LETFVACFAPHYQSEQPVHPNRAFTGSEQVRKNWAAFFEGVPDFRADLLSSVAQDNTVWSEWRWQGTRRDGTKLDMRGVTLFGVEDGQIAWGRLYMEETEVTGDDIDATMRNLTRQSSQSD
jgi:ketosteroid isomerase-like protein